MRIFTIIVFFCGGVGGVGGGVGGGGAFVSIENCPFLIEFYDSYHIPKSDKKEVSST